MQASSFFPRSDAILDMTVKRLNEGALSSSSHGVIQVMDQFPVSPAL